MKILAFALLACCGAAPLPAQQAPVSSIRVSGDAQVTAKPDRVQIDIGVTTRADKSQEAAAQNARQVDTVLTAVKKAAGPTAVLKTVNYSLSPNYKYQNGHEPLIVGYLASNLVQVTLDDLAAQFSVSRERIRQIEARAFEKVRKAARKRPGSSNTSFNPLTSPSASWVSTRLAPAGMVIA